MIVKANKWGKDIAIRIPAKLAKVMNLSDGTIVEMVMVNNQIVIRLAPSTRPAYTLEELLAGITDENRHPEIGF